MVRIRGGRRRRRGRHRRRHDTAVAVLLALAAPMLAVGTSAVVTPAPLPVVAMAPIASPPAATPPSLPPTPPAGVTSTRVPAAACSDYATAEQAQGALDADPALAAVLDSDGDGRPCELRWPRTPPLPAADPAPAVEPPAPRAPPAGQRCPDSGFGGVRPHVAVVGHHLAARFGVDRVLGVGSRALATSDHPRGLAIDLFVDRATGDALAAYVLEHRAEWGVAYVIWRQRINLGGGWDLMADRGGITANHYDHTHISFVPAVDPPALTC